VHLGLTRAPAPRTGSAPGPRANARALEPRRASGWTANARHRRADARAPAQAPRIVRTRARQSVGSTVAPGLQRTSDDGTPRAMPCARGTGQASGVGGHLERAGGAAGPGGPRVAGRGRHKDLPCVASPLGLPCVSLASWGSAPQSMAVPFVGQCCRAAGCTGGRAQPLARPLRSRAALGRRRPNARLANAAPPHRAAPRKTVPRQHPPRSDRRRPAQVASMPLAFTMVPRRPILLRHLPVAQRPGGIDSGFAPAAPAAFAQVAAGAKRAALWRR